MKKTLITFISLTICTIAFGQSKIEKKTAAIVDEGKKLYRSEMASWYGTDIFFEKFGDRKTNVGGYFSYTENDISKCIFFSKGDNPKVIGTISFDSSYNVNTATADGSERDFTGNELDLFAIRKTALAEITADTFFKGYKNTNLNLIPLIDKGKKKVYVLTGPENTGVVIFGNDYLLTFDRNNNLKDKKQLHKNIIMTEYGEGQDSTDTVVGGMHTHLPSTGDFITATDICTLMLYEKFAKWEQYYVVSENYFSIWNCQTDQLVILSKDVWDRINKDDKNRDKN